MSDWRDPDFDDTDDSDTDDPAADTIRCSHCGASIYEDSVRCPYCGWYVTPETSPWSGRPVWWILLALLGIAALVVALVRLA